MSNKTISINPSLFSVGGSGKNKTKKNKSPKNITPIISPNILKNKLLKRIKEHKNRENKPVTEEKNDLPSVSTTSKEDIIKYSDEFNDSINYLQSLSKQKKIDEEKVLYDKNREKRRKELQNKTLKNYSYITKPSEQSSESTFVFNELPEELKENLIQVNSNNIVVSNETPIHIKYNIDNAIPYGNLKGGIKPTMRTWNKTQKNFTNDNVNNYNDNSKNNHNIISQGKNNTQLERENKVNSLKEKIKQKQLTLPKEEALIQTINPNTQIKPIESSEQREQVEQYAQVDLNLPNNNKFIKQIHKKTICKKYTLGKSRIKNKVGILLKNRQTRKNVLTAQKELKQHSINDIKKYLRNHNLIKIGSNAPNDILRKIYESSILTGNITNNNKDILIHNFMKDDTQI
jgi:hypothetical protein